MSSLNPWTLSGIERTSADLKARVAGRLADFCADPARHARFLNTLALLEHIGSRKIMMSQSHGLLAEGTLKHLAEETRHSFFFRRAAQKVAGRELDFSPRDTLAPASAKMYFGRLDATISASLEDDLPLEAPYLYVSMIIEVRAIWTYRLYRDVLERRGVGISLKSILAEEELHLTDMAGRLATMDRKLAARIPEFAGVEDGLFRAFWSILEAASEEKIAA